MCPPPPIIDPATPLLTDRDEQWGHLFEVCVYAHVALRMLLAFFQPVNCIVWPIKALKRLVAVSKLYKYWGTGCTAE